MLPENLYASLQNEMDNTLDIGKIMNTWVIKPGYPVINVNVDRNRKEVVVTQKRFLLAEPEHNDKKLWEVPLTYATAFENSDFKNTKPNTILTLEKQSIALKTEIDWIVFNVQQTGSYEWNNFFLFTFCLDNSNLTIIFNISKMFFVLGYYRVNYDDKTWENIAKVLNKSHLSIHVLNRAQVIKLFIVYNVSGSIKKIVNFFLLFYLHGASHKLMNK